MATRSKSKGSTRVSKTRSVPRAARPSEDALDECLERVTREGRVLVFRRGRKSIAALVPVDDEAFVEELEDAVDARDARRRLAEMKRTGEKGVPFEKVCKELGLE